MRSRWRGATVAMDSKRAVMKERADMEHIDASAFERHTREKIRLLFVNYLHLKYRSWSFYH